MSNRDLVEKIIDKLINGSCDPYLVKDAIDRIESVYYRSADTDIITPPQDAPITYWDEPYRRSMYFLEHKCGLSESLAMAVIEHFRGMEKERAASPQDGAEPIQLSDTEQTFPELLKDFTPPMPKILTSKQDGGTKLPCGCDADGNPVFWNEFNKVVQCHKCGHVYSPIATEKQDEEAQT